MNTSFTTFENTLSGLSNGLQIRHIATFELQTCTPQEIVKDVFDRNAGFDQIPVRENERVIGVLERNGAQDGLVKHQMQGLSDGNLVSADESLLAFIPLMAHAPYFRLVLSGTRVDGIVTRSDLLKLPVRLLAFARISQLEMIMGELIRLYWPDNDDWFFCLSNDNQKKIKDFQKKAKKSRSDPPLLEFSGFKDKGTVLTSIYALGDHFSKDIEGLYDLRNQVAHAGNFADGETQLELFIEKLKITDYWIVKLNELIIDPIKRKNLVR